MPNEVVIIVKARNDTRAVFDRIRQDARNLGTEMGEDVTENFSTSFNQRMTQQAGNRGGDIARIGDVLGETIGSRVAERVTERINRDVTERIRRGGAGGDGGDGTYRDANGRLRDGRGRFVAGAGSGGAGGAGGRGGDANVDIDRASLLSRAGGIGNAISDKITGALGTAMSSFFSGDLLSILAKTLTVGALITVFAPTIGAALSSVLLTAFGTGVIGAGIYAAIKNDPQLKAAFKELGERWKGIFKDVGQNFRLPTRSILDQLDNVTDQAKPIFDRMTKSMAPVADKLGTQGVGGFLQNLLPALERFAKASEPLIETLADELPGIGDALGDMFDIIGKESGSANKFWNDFLNALQIAIRTLGVIISVLASLYDFARTVFIGLVKTVLQVFDGILTGAEKAFGWIPGVGEKLGRARQQFTDFRKKVNRELDSIDDVDVTVRIRQVFTTVGTAVADVGRILSRRAAGGISGAASGGIRSNLTWVGEHGPELVQLPAGSSVKSNPDSMRMAGQGGGGAGAMLVQLVLDGRVLAEQMVDPQRDLVNRRFGGSVQAAYGRPF